jgi:uncharacterized protein (DUF58 family)
MSPTPRAAMVLGAIAVSALVLPLEVVALAALALLAVTLVDAWSVRATPRVERELPRVLSRGVASHVAITAAQPRAGRLRLRQPLPAALVLQPPEAERQIDAQLVASVRGRHELPAIGTRAAGRLGLGAWYHHAGEPADLHVYPNLVLARRLAAAARSGLFQDSRRRSRGSLGIGTEFESVREWQPDDDIRHVNWRATERTGHPMTNRYRLEQTRQLTFLLDTGRLMASPLGDRTRLDTALDALAAVALAADELGDHCGAIAFDGEVRARIAPARAAGREIVRAMFDLQPRPVDSDYGRAFTLVAGGKRSLVLVLSDLFDDAAAGALVEAVPVIARRHVVIVATAADPDLEQLVAEPPATRADVFEAAAALDLLDARSRAATLIRRTGARVIEAAPDALPAACVRAYVRAKAELRL